MYCSNCATQNSKNASFCVECGQSLDHSKSTKEPTSIHTQAVASPGVQRSTTHQAVRGVSRFIKVVFYLFYAVMIILVPAVVWEASLGRVCQPLTQNSYGQYVLGQCVNTASGLLIFRNVIFALFITYAVLEVIKSIGIYIAHGTKLKDQNTFFMQAMRENNRKKSKS
jgi:hypothetical protein